MRIILFIVCTILAILLSASIIATVPDVWQRFSRGDRTDLDFLLVQIAIWVVAFTNLRLNFTILRINGVLTFTRNIQPPKGNLSSALLLSIAFLIILAAAHMPQFYVSYDCFGTIGVSLPGWMFLFDLELAQWDSVSYTLGFPQIVTFSFYSIGFSSYIFLRNSGFIRRTTVQMVMLPIRPWAIYCQMLLGSLFIVPSVFLLIRLPYEIYYLMSAQDLDENVIISFAIFGFVVSFVQSSLILLFGVWIVRDGVILKKRLV